MIIFMAIMTGMTIMTIMDKDKDEFVLLDDVMTVNVHLISLTIEDIKEN